MTHKNDRRKNSSGHKKNKNNSETKHSSNSPSDGLPSKEELIDFLQTSQGSQNKRDIARAFGIKGQDRTQLRRLLREISEAGLIEKTNSHAYKTSDSLPDRALIEIIGLDGDGELRAKPVEWAGKSPVPLIYVMDKRRSEGYLSPGDKVLARLKKVDKLEYEAFILKSLAETESAQIVGIFKPYKIGGYVTPTNKKDRNEYYIPPEHLGERVSGDLVVIEPIPPGPKVPRSKNPARIVKFLGKKEDPRLISLIAIHSHGIPTVFPKDVMKEAEKLKEPEIEKGRKDLRDIPLVTVDGADARDFDDAIFAEPDPKNPDGWHLIVAIADVSYYVRTFGALDKEAFKRGNSTYFADRVVPMLPERLSNDLCSLRPKVNRACLAAHLYIDKDAKLTSWRFERGLMRSAARLTYEQVESAHLGAPDETTGPLMEEVIRPLYKAYSLLKRARELRGALDIDLPERKALIDDKGQITAIVPRIRLDSHRLIEEFMILANVAAAEALEDKNAPCVYRVHDRPAFDRLEATRDFLKELGYSLPKTDQLHPRNINHLLKLSADREDKELVHTVLLRTQAQAVYSPENKGHFGLALEKYAHFTSPIRRYADLLVHRALVRAYGLGEGGLNDEEADDLTGLSEHISVTERRSMIAERDVMDRFTAQFLSANVGKDFKGKISGVTRFGIFVTLDETGADGIVPMRHLPRDYYVHDERRHALVGKDYGRTYRLSDPVVVKLVEADPLRGSTVFELLDGFTGGAGKPPHRKQKRGKKEGLNKSRDRRKNSKNSKNRKRKKRR